MLRHLVRIVGLLLLAALSLQLYFALRVGLMSVVDPQSTTFQRSEIRRLLLDKHEVAWSQHWVAYPHIADTLKRAVIASEDASFVDHGGVEWDAIEKAWDKNQRAEAKAEKANARLAPTRPKVAPKIVGGSTITQQLAKNLFLSGERTPVRKLQEIAIAYMLETLLNKQRILEIYLNNVEWGEGLFGAEAASRYYFRISADKPGAYQAARLAVMLPAPKRFEKRPSSPYVLGRANVIVGRMGSVELP